MRMRNLFSFHVSFFYFLNLIFCNRASNAKIIYYPFNYFLCFFIIICFVSNNNFTKERRIYEHLWTYFLYNYIRLYMFTYIYIYILI